MADISKHELNELEDKYRRLYAEFDNYKKRVAKEKADLMRNAEQSLLTDLLDVLDDFDSYLTHRNDEAVKLIEQKFRKVLGAHGLTLLNPEGKEFSPDIAEAVQITDVNDPKQDGMIIKVINLGYAHNGNIIRYPKVIVGKYKGE